MSKFLHRSALVGHRNPVLYRGRLGIVIDSYKLVSGSRLDEKIYPTSLDP